MTNTAREQEAKKIDRLDLRSHRLALADYVISEREKARLEGKVEVLNDLQGDWAGHKDCDYCNEIRGFISERLDEFSDEHFKIINKQQEGKG